MAAGVTEEAFNAYLDSQSTPEPTTPDPAPEAAAPAPETPAAEAPPEDEEPKSFSADYVKELRRESANYRTRAKQYEVFERYTEEDRQVWNSLAETMLNDPRAAAAQMKQIAEALLADEEAETEPEAPAHQGPDPKYLTREDYDRLRQEEAQALQVSKIEADARALGYDTEGTDYINLLLIANRETNGDIHKAHETIKAREQAIVQKYLAEKAAEANGTPKVPAAGSAVSGERQITNLKDASKAVRDFLGG